MELFDYKKIDESYDFLGVLDIALEVIAPHHRSFVKTLIKAQRSRDEK